MASIVDRNDNGSHHITDGDNWGKGASYPDKPLAGHRLTGASLEFFGMLRPQLGRHPFG